MEDDLVGPIDHKSKAAWSLSKSITLSLSGINTSFIETDLYLLMMSSRSSILRLRFNIFDACDFKAVSFSRSVSLKNFISSDIWISFLA